MQRQYSSNELEAGNQSLLELALMLDVADEQHAARGEPAYSQADFRRCALAHWERVHPAPRGDVHHHKSFAVNDREWDELFHATGCREAGTAKDAAKYLRWFVARRRRLVHEAVSS